MNAITVKNISKTFHVKRILGKPSINTLQAIDNISFSIQQGTMVGIIGRNGSGKTTLLRIISGIYPPDSGNVQINGKMSPLLQIGTGFHNDLNASENIMMFGLLLGLTKPSIKEKMDDIIEFAELQDFSGMKLKNYSSGMKSRLAFSTALHVDPDILLVDEILAVGDKSFRKKSSDAFLTFKEKKKTILLASHNTATITQLCDKVLLLDKGKLVFEGNPEEAVKEYEKIA